MGTRSSSGRNIVTRVCITDAVHSEANDDRAIGRWIPAQLRSGRSYPMVVCRRACRKSDSSRLDSAFNLNLELPAAHGHDSGPGPTRGLHGLGPRLFFRGKQDSHARDLCAERGREENTPSLARRARGNPRRSALKVFLQGPLVDLPI